MVTPNQDLTLRFDRDQANRLLAAQGGTGKQIDAARASLAIIYSYGDYAAATSFVRSDDPAARPIEITRDSCVPANKVVAFFKNPLGNLDAAQTAPLKIEKALIGQVPGREPRLVGRPGLVPVHGLLRHGTGRVRMARPLGVDAHPHPLQRHEHCPGP